MDALIGCPKHLVKFDAWGYRAICTQWQNKHEKSRESMGISGKNGKSMETLKNPRKSWDIFLVANKRLPYTYIRPIYVSMKFIVLNYLLHQRICYSSQYLNAILPYRRQIDHCCPCQFWRTHNRWHCSSTLGWHLKTNINPFQPFLWRTNVLPLYLHSSGRFSHFLPWFLHGKAGRRNPST